MVRYLRSQVGRPWDDVYSEISQCLRPTSAVQQHVRDHLWDFVARHVEEADDGRVLSYWRGELEEIDGRRWGSQFYVCPRSGLLRAAPVRARERRGAPPRNDGLVWVARDRVLKEIDGVWYAFDLQAFPAGEVEQRSARDLLLGEPVIRLVRRTELRHRAAAMYRRNRVYAATKRQLGKRELRALRQPGGKRGK
ncbi:MAG: hypothetical protein AAF430_12460 [Myxococcota bacterium]